VLIWPIDPVLEADQKAGALWLENRGTAPASLQVRVFAWRQGDYQEQFQAQREIIGSPPVANIPPGQKQLIRLTRTGSSPVGQEQAYRIIIDEIPSPLPTDTTSQAPRRQSVCRCAIRYRCSSMAKGCGARPTRKASAMPKASASRNSAGAR
jgi:P pilus assembly protein, chaperone PapD